MRATLKDWSIPISCAAIAAAWCFSGESWHWWMAGLWALAAIFFSGHALELMTRGWDEDVR